MGIFSRFSTPNAASKSALLYMFFIQQLGRSLLRFGHHNGTTGFGIIDQPTVKLVHLFQ